MTPFFTPMHLGKKAYISGPMTGIPESNRAAFDQMALRLRQMGYAVCSPAETSDFLGELTHAEFLRFDLERVLEADLVVVLDGWQDSKGALAEIHAALVIGIGVVTGRGDEIDYGQWKEAVRNGV